MKSRFLFFLIVLVVITAIPFSRGYGQQQVPADMVIQGGKIITMDEKQPVVEALAIERDRIVAVGSREEIRRYIGDSTTILELKGLVAIPGLIEGHGHLLPLGRSKMKIDLSQADNWEKIVSLVKKSVREKKPGEWILGFGWHQEKWDTAPMPQIEGYPTDETLNRVSPDNPVLLTHASGHALFANARARERAGVTKETPDPAGGRILRDANRNPVGVFFDAAASLVSSAHEADLAKRTPEQVEAQAREAIRLAVEECLSNGITSFQDASSSFKDIDLYKRLVDENRLGIRLWVMVNEPNKMLADHLARYRLINYGDTRLTVRAIKKFMDGALGSHTAWLLQPYTDLAGSIGLNVETPENIMETARLAIRHNFQLGVHAIGDRANRETLDMYETAFHDVADAKNLRWRIEHAQHISSTDIPRFGQLGVIASMQAVHCTSDGSWVVKRIGAERAQEGAYVWQKLLHTGAVLANGTDAPVENVNPFDNFYAAITRKLPNGTAFYPEQRMSRRQALKSYTLDNAFAAFEEQIKGSLTPGKLADITVISADLMTAPEDTIRDIQVYYTIIGGKIIYNLKTPEALSKRRRIELL